MSAPGARGHAEAALGVVGEPTEYVRVDVLGGSMGPMIIEVELIEPMLFFDFFPETIEVFADHIEMSLNNN